MTITPAQLEEWKRLESAATEGPWKAEFGNLRYPCQAEDAEIVANAAFIAASRTALPALIAEVERLNAEVSLMARERLTEEAQHRGEYDLTPPKDSTNE
jgi:hypothetical protein